MISLQCRRLKLRTSLLVLTLAVMLPALILSCKKKNSENENPENLTEETSVEEESENEEPGFYSPSEDDASWVDSLLMHAEEERIAEELAKMEESYSEYQVEEDVPDKETEEESSEESPAPQEEPEAKNPVEQFFEEAKEGKIITDKKSQMSFYEFDNEILVPQHTSEGLIVVRSTGENVIRNYYDEKSRLSKKEEWRIRSVEDATRLRTENYTWSEETGKIEKKEIVTDTTIENVSYNKEGSPLRSSKYAVKDAKKFIISERSWKYDDENRVIKDEQKEYKYKDENYKKLLSTFVRGYEYGYKTVSKAKDEDKNKDKNKDKKEDEIPPDTKYYENGSLKKQNVYSQEKGNYISWVYFDENLSVKSYFEEDIRVKDEYYNNGKLFRTKVYEKPEGDKNEK